MSAVGWRICASDFLGEMVCSYTEKETPAEAFAACVLEFSPSAGFDGHMVRRIDTKEEYYLLVNNGIPPDELELPDDVLPLI